MTGGNSAFQSTRPLRGATAGSVSSMTIHLMISIHAPLAGRDINYLDINGVDKNISIHAPLAGRDFKMRPVWGAGGISIHAPLAGRDVYSCMMRLTLSHFNPRAPCGARRYQLKGAITMINFNPRAPCGARRVISQSSSARDKFQSTRPLRGATADLPHVTVGQQNSIHAPLAGRDARRGLAARRPGHFNPRAPCGARRRCAGGILQYKAFQSTRPLRGATLGRYQLAHRRDFNPRAPCGARPYFPREHLPPAAISIHAPLAGRDNSTVTRWLDRAISIHAPLAGRDDPAALAAKATTAISIHAPLAGRDPQKHSASAHQSEFQSTRPLRGATRGSRRSCR